MSDEIANCEIEAAELPLKELEWIRRSDVRRICGVGRDILDVWVANEQVEAHKLNAGKNGTVIFKFQDILKAIANSPRYLPSQTNNFSTPKV